MKSYVKKFGISKKTLESWKSDEICMPGKINSLVILVPGWSSITRQIEPLSKKINKFGYAVKVLKIPGHGTSPEDLENVCWKDWVGSVIAEIRICKKVSNFDKIIIGGVSMGGNVCLLASLEENVDGVILIGTPVHLKGHMLIKISSKIMPLFKKYTKKIRPRNIFFDEKDSYQYFPTKNMKEVLQTIERSVKLLKNIKVPILILQIKNDFFVTKYSPWIIYKNVSSKVKEVRWIHTDSENHVPQKGEEVNKTAEVIKQFVNTIDK